jgi:hypothetical protein
MCRGNITDERPQSAPGRIFEHLKEQSHGKLPELRIASLHDGRLPELRLSRRRSLSAQPGEPARKA